VVGCLVGAERAAEAEIEEAWIAVGGDGGIAGDAEGFKLVVGEEGVGAVGTALGYVAGCAVAAFGVVEEGEAALLLRGEGGFAVEPGVVAAGVGVEAGVVELEGLDGEEEVGEGGFGGVERAA
jgi:hypothetical protein